MTLLIDTIILVLLGGTVGYAVILHRRLSNLMAALDGLRPVVETFSAAVDRTEGSVKTLRSVAQDMTPARHAVPGGWRNVPEPQDAALQEMRASAMLRMPAKMDLIRNFFDDARKHHA
ncbi:hypothetical protein P6F26_09245 [Roseibacterium sp. SDUM158017]|uniref:hypothetical protein n=1 Tax=Roseicyclus salinarum TaxID=3036773 RepID=UPI0024152B4D|nr:hypothetical protein [Roseibacterium sp. SDUM158017]MDG4648631.1 hypothetical protein [Roseibacterium sp. SDUM158017]